MAGPGDRAGHAVSVGLYSIVVLLAYRLYRATGSLPVRRLAWYNKQQATFSDALAAVRYYLWKVEHFSMSLPNPERVEIPRLSLQCLLQSVCYTH